MTRRVRLPSSSTITLRALLESRLKRCCERLLLTPTRSRDMRAGLSSTKLRGSGGGESKLRRLSILSPGRFAKPILSRVMDCWAKFADDNSIVRMANAALIRREWNPLARHLDFGIATLLYIVLTSAHEHYCNVRVCGRSTQPPFPLGTISITFTRSKEISWIRP